MRLEAGPEMDVLIDEHVRPLKRNGTFDGYPAYDNPKDDDLLIVGLPQYSTDIAAAWMVVEKMGNKIDNMYPEKGNWTVCFFAEDNYITVEANTAPLAICRAALLAVQP